MANYYDNLYNDLRSHMRNLERRVHPRGSLTIEDQHSVWSSTMTLCRVMSDPRKTKIICQVLGDEFEMGRWLSLFARSVTVLRLMYLGNTAGVLHSQIQHTIEVVEDFLASHAWR